MLEADATAKLEKAGIPFSRSRFVDEIGKAGNPRLIVMVTLDIPNGFVHPLETEVKLLSANKGRMGLLDRAGFDK